MTTNYPPPAGSTIISGTANVTGYVDLEDEPLLSLYDYVSRQAKGNIETLGRIEQVILQRMEERGATAIPDETYTCESPLRYDYPPGCFSPLLEIFNDVELSECYTAAHKELVPEHYEDVLETWETRKVLSLAAKRGHEAMDVIEARRQPKSRTLIFKRRVVQ